MSLSYWNTSYVAVIELHWESGDIQRLVEPNSRVFPEFLGMQIGESIDLVASGDGSKFTMTRLENVWVESWYGPGDIPEHRELSPDEIGENGTPIYS